MADLTLQSILEKNSAYTLTYSRPSDFWISAGYALGWGARYTEAQMLEYMNNSPAIQTFGIVATVVTDYNLSSLEITLVPTGDYSLEAWDIVIRQFLDILNLSTMTLTRAKVGGYIPQGILDSITTAIGTSIRNIVAPTVGTLTPLLAILGFGVLIILAPAIKAYLPKGGN